MVRQTHNVNLKEILMRVSNSRLILFGQVLAGLLSLFSVALTAKYVGPIVFGFCSIFFLFMNVLITLLDYGACSWASREFASGRMSLRTYNEIRDSKTKLFLFILLLTPVFFVFLQNEYRSAAILLLYPALMNRANFNQQLFLAKELVPQSVVLAVVDRFCWLLIVPFSMIQMDKTLAFAAPIICGLLAQNILGQVFAKRRIVSEGKKEVYRKKELFSLSRHFGRISATGVLSNFDAFVLSLITSIGDSSGYLLSQRFRNPLTIIFNSIGMRLRPIAASRNRVRLIREIKVDGKMLLFGSISCIASAVFLLFFAKKFFGEDFKYVNVFLFWGTLSSLPLGILLLSSSLLSSLGFEKYSARLNLSYSVSSLIGVSVGALFFGSIGAVVFVFVVITCHAILFSSKFFTEVKSLK